MKRHQKEQQAFVERTPEQAELDSTTIAVQHPVTGAVEHVRVRQAGPLPPHLVREVIAQNREAFERLAPYDGPVSDE